MAARSFSSIRTGPCRSRPASTIRAAWPRFSSGCSSPTARTAVWRIDSRGKAVVFVAAAAFPAPVHTLNDIVVDPESGTLYVTDRAQR